MRLRQNLCAIAALLMFLASAGLIETHFEWSLILLAGMIVPMFIGRLDKYRVSVRDIERQCKNVR